MIAMLRRLLQVLEDALKGVILGSVVGFAVYSIWFYVAFARTGDGRSAMATGFTVGACFVPLGAILGLWRGIRRKPSA